ncbi:hypothetical protein P7C71_g5025, partial [Lecanoromycetidae sp. Uapishka_2]
MKDSPGEMYALAVVLTMLALTAVVLRCYARRIKKQSLGWDDYTITLALCIPLSLNWTGLGGNNFQCIDENMMYLAQAFSDVITDIMILAIPLPCIWALQMSTKRKLAVCGVFLLGALTVAASVTRLVFTYKIAAATLTGDMDLTYLLTPIVYWPMVESSLGIVGACLPSMRPVVTDGFVGSLWTMLSSSSIWERSRSGSKGSPKMLGDLEGNPLNSSMEELKLRGLKSIKISQRQSFPS